MRFFKRKKNIYEAIDEYNSECNKIYESVFHDLKKRYELEPNNLINVYIARKMFFAGVRFQNKTNINAY